MDFILSPSWFSLRFDIHRAKANVTLDTGLGGICPSMSVLEDRIYHTR